MTTNYDTNTFHGDADDYFAERRKHREAGQAFWLEEAAREQIIADEHLRLAAEAQERRVDALIKAGFNIRRIGQVAHRDMEREG